MTRCESGRNLRLPNDRQVNRNDRYCFAKQCSIHFDVENLRLVQRPLPGPRADRSGRKIAVAAHRIRFGESVAGEHKKPEFLRLNYSGTLPVLELQDGTLIAECTAITQYLDALDGSPTLTGRTPVEKGLIQMMTKRAEIEFLDAVSVYFHHATPGLGPEVELYQNAEWGNRMRDKAVRGMRYFDEVLRRQPFVAGDSFSMADIAVLGGMIFRRWWNYPCLKNARPCASGMRACKSGRVCSNGGRW